MSAASPAFNRLSLATAPALAEMLARVEADDDAAWFRPHPFGERYLIDSLCSLDMRDLHYILHDRGKILAYGLLRGWDEGYEVPSLGIAVSPDYRSLGLGGLTMDWLHLAARLRGSRLVRLRVDPNNTRAIALYLAKGYLFEASPVSIGPLTGIKALATR